MQKEDRHNECLNSIAKKKLAIAYTESATLTVLEVAGFATGIGVVVLIGTTAGCYTTSVGFLFLSVWDSRLWRCC